MIKIPELGPGMTTTYGFGFDDLARPRSRAARIARIDALATLLDTALVIPGTGVRFGLDALIGLFPVVGDIITTALSLFIVHEAYQLGVPGHVIARTARALAFVPAERSLRPRVRLVAPLRDKVISSTR